MAFAFIFPIRIVQAVLAVIVLGLMAYVASAWGWGYYGYHWSPSQVNFLIFTSVWTLLVIAYLMIAPARFPAASHRFAILAVEAITMLFWFAGFIALAVLLTAAGCTGSSGGVCSAAIAGDVFAAFEWVLFAITTVLAALGGFGTRGDHVGKHGPTVTTQV